MTIKEIIRALEQYAPLPLQDSYDNAGLQVGLTDAVVSGALLCLDVTEEVINEAIEKGCNLIIAHHPLLFRGLKSISGGNYIERCVIKAIQHNVCIYAAHTNLDNASNGVSFRMAKKLQLDDVRFLSSNESQGVESGAGVIGKLSAPMPKGQFLQLLKKVFRTGCIKYSASDERLIQNVALCGGAGAFLADEAIKKGADAFITGEIKYHDFFGRGSDILLAEIGHYESEQYTLEIFREIIQEKFPNLPINETEIKTNPIFYL